MKFFLDTGNVEEIRRADYDDSLQWPSREFFEEDVAGLNRLAQACLVRNQDASSGVREIPQ